MQQRRLVSWARWFGAISMWPLDFARTLLQRQAGAWRRAPTDVDREHCARAAGLGRAAHAWAAAGLAWPFDLVRAQRAAGVQAGLVEPSLLASAEFERHLGRLERLTLGPWARSV